MKIKITKKLLQEVSETPLDEQTLPPKGKVKGASPEDTEKFSPKGGPEFQTKRADIKYQTSSSDPTLKVSPEELERKLKSDLSSVIKEPGLLDKVYGYIKSKFLSAPVPAPAPLEEPQMEPEPKEEPMRKPDLSKYRNPAKEFGIPKLDTPQDPGVDLGDAMEDPDPYGRKARLKETGAVVDKYGKLQEIAERHFKTRK